MQQTENSPAELHDAACECIVSALYRSEDVTAHKKLALSLQTACYGMMGAFQIAVATEDCDRYKFIFYGWKFLLCRNSLSLSGITCPAVFFFSLEISILKKKHIKNAKY